MCLFYTSVRETCSVFCRQSSVSPALSLRASRGSACTRDRGAELRDTVEEPASSACRPRCLRQCLQTFKVKRRSLRWTFGGRPSKLDY